MNKVRMLGFGIAFLFCGWIGHKTFLYLTHNNNPVVTVVGLKENGSYKGVMSCSLSSQNDYKVDSVQLFLDGKPLEVDGAQRVRSAAFAIPFDIETKELKNGVHELELHAVDSSYHRNKYSSKCNFFIDNQDLKGALLSSSYKVNQGKTLHLKLQLNKQVDKAQVKLQSTTYDCYPEDKGSTLYETFIPIDCEERPNEYALGVDIEDKVGNTLKLAGAVTIAEFKFPKQKGFTVSTEKIEEEKEVSMSNRILDDALAKWLQDSPKQKMWTGEFEIPTVVQRYSTPYGELRTTPERGRYYHRAVDIVNHPQSVIWASQNGRVIIKDRYLDSGNTIVLDHGLGVFTLYYHLDSFPDLEIGDAVKKGNPIGKLGMTGYATGYHLHWELRVGGVAVDPLEWTKKSFI